MGAIENTWKDNLKRQMVIKLGTTTNDEATVISNMVDGGSAGALPAVTSTDNGKVLTVANGAWVAGNASGGGGMLITPTIENDYVIMNKTWKEIHDAMVSGVVPLYAYTYSGDPFAEMSAGDYADFSPVIRFSVGGGQFLPSVTILSYDLETVSVYYSMFTCETENDYPKLYIGD